MAELLKTDKITILWPLWQLARLTLEWMVSHCQHCICCICILVVFVLPLWQLAGSTVAGGGPIIVSSSVVNSSTRPQLLQWSLKDPHPPTQLPASSQPKKITQLTLYSTYIVNLVLFAQCHFLSAKLLWPSRISPLKDGQGNLTWYNVHKYTDNKPFKRGIT